MSELSRAAVIKLHLQGQKNADFSVWSNLEKRACSKPHAMVEELKESLICEWRNIPQQELRDACLSAARRMQAIVDAEGGHIE